jgi:S-adenosylmethionine synthetase
MIEKVNLKHIDKKCDFIADVVHDFYFNKDINVFCSIDVLYNSGSYNIVGQLHTESSSSLDELKHNICMHAGTLNGTSSLSPSNIDISFSSFSSQSLYYLENNMASDSCVSVGYACSGSSHQGLPMDVIMGNIINNYLQQEDGPTKLYADYTNNVLNIDVISPSSHSFDDCLQTIQNFSSVGFETGSINFNLEDFSDEEEEHSNGMSGMKLQGDLYGSYCSTSSGPLSGRDIMQIDRLTTLASRKLAKEIWEKNGKVNEVRVEMCYKKGESQPLYVKNIIDGDSSYITGENFSPNNLLEYIGGKTELSIYSNTSHIM